MKIDSPYYLGVAIMIMIHSLNASGFNLLLGYTGIISLGQAAFFGLGAYISGVLSSAYGWDAILTLPVAAVSAFFLALLVGWPVLRLHGHYLAMATLGFGMIMYIFMNEMSFITGGPSGLMGIGDFTLFGKAFPFEDEFFIVMSVYFILALTILELIDKSFLHYKMKFIKSSETASASYGINVVSTKLFVFASVAAFTALNGSMYAFYTHFISPVSFGLKYSIELVAMATVGGLGYVTGGVVGAVLLGLIPELFAGLEEFEMIIYGTFLAVVVMFAPGGVVGTVIKLWRRKDA
ncbi:branched-chain amino acid ABC transporter permease [Limisalsivibrio acetivorans]|uniref:branched-chain amino acid ABC transporter permease n=1 Tax=Limisalsivibrio acetivorans TaxID=1304888 RepID=UPI001EE30E7B|nr:branched-chain amino acid ABC transporter permease [Limisalsivibrio acetivorans]